MKFKKILRTLAVTALMFVGGSAINASADAKTESPSDTINIQLHKMKNTSAGTSLQNTGNTITGDALGGLTPYDAEKYGTVGFTLYEFTDNSLIPNPNNVSEADYKEAISALTATIHGGSTELSDMNTAQAKFIKDNVANGKIAEVGDEQLISNKDGLANFTSVPNNKTYLILETTVPEEGLNSLSSPLIFTLPIVGLTDTTTAHLYPKNQLDESSSNLTKLGQDPANPTNPVFGPLEGVEFTLSSKNSGSQTVTTLENGTLDLSDLIAGVTYTLTESSLGTNKGYEGIAGITAKFKVDTDGNITFTEKSKHFGLTDDGKGIIVKNYLKLGGADFVKVDADDTTKLLEGAKFIVKKESFDESGNPTTEYAKFNNSYEFTGWGTIDEAKASTQLVSKDDGTFGFTGIPYVYDKRNDAEGKVTKYSLVETQAPSGYAKLAANDSQLNFEIGSKDQLIKNKRYSLPITGGMGIWLFVIAGLALMGGSGYLYYKKQRNA
ncbi:SpaA isopeptide-forming pilin-related protein [Lentilactobacillus senioris]|uniref:SpaA isopeptide-forming pilin-related protein n=1 Tax=Lentilactobacillus senioris TaxID=931534 RepID=UPI0022830377|nr:pilin N-terminal domain-containing protein [Lentilactobacillus senioris]MCY9806034.1 SpaA isopeptide-forming pilin-related protein [Lentilactobacillus senioris]